MIGAPASSQMSGVTVDSQKPSGACHMWCLPRAGTSIDLCGFCVKSSQDVEAGMVSQADPEVRRGVPGCGVARPTSRAMTTSGHPGPVSSDQRPLNGGCALRVDRNGCRARDGIMRKSEHGLAAVEEPCRRCTTQTIPPRPQAEPISRGLHGQPHRPTTYANCCRPSTGRSQWGAE